MKGATASVSPGMSDVCLSAPPVAPTSSPAPAPAPAPSTPQPARRAQHTHQADAKQHKPETACPSSSCSVLPGNGHSHHANEKLLWWPMDHITVQGSRLAVGGSCYVITGHCVLCNIDDDLDMVECSRCRRFTHFLCTFPKLTSTPAEDFFCHFCCNSNPVPSQQTAQAMIDAGTPGVGIMWITLMYGEMYPDCWQSQAIWLQGFMYSKVAGPSHELVLSSVLADGVTPDAVLGVCPVDVRAAPILSSPVRRQSHYYSTTMDTGAKVDWEQLLLDNRLEQYSDMYRARPPRELKQFIHSFRLPTPDTYRSMLGTATTHSSSKHRLASNQSHGLEPSGKRQKVDSDSFLRRVRSLVQPLQVEVVSKLSAVTGCAVNVHRYMAAGSCIGVEVWQRGGLLGVQLEEELTSLVEHWEGQDASVHTNSIVDSSVAKRRKVYFGCRDVHNDPQLHWDVEAVPTVITDRLLPRLVALGVISAASDVHQAVLNIYHKGGYLVAHQDSEAHYQQPVVMIQVRSESALSFGYKAGGWSHTNEDLRFLRIHKPLFSLTVLKNEAFHVLKHCVCCGDTQTGRCATLILRNITPSQKPGLW